MVPFIIIIMYAIDVKEIAWVSVGALGRCGASVVHVMRRGMRASCYDFVECAMSHHGQ